ncbi:GEVED domain-containing protein [Chryseobacterium arthrosphaerae]|uniref:GEVED domain-containing protein n=1 Tax=Chryseobacterium arthrosphaerae TaxID=651561 RepID=UPI001F4A60F3|nr:fibronectin type III domain-containing protein [Chryseobacterium arthrosphaerae]MDG4652788.1 fibronectin type III domain-containing protein [Chryseobacterium arthrosphaerae]
MNKTFISFFFLCLFAMAHAQWTPAAPDGKLIRDGLPNDSYYSLDISLLKSQLKNAQETGKNAKPVIISLPTLNGKIEKFSVYSFPVVVKELAEQYQLGSYVGVGIDDPGKYLRFSLAPNDFQSMIITGEGSEFIEPANTAKTVYRVYPKTKGGKSGFVCSTGEEESDKLEIEKLHQQGQSFTNQVTNFGKSSDRKYRTLRLALSVCGEYTQYHGGTVAGALAAMNATLTRINGVYEKDFALHLNLQNFPSLIYTNANTDPYSATENGTQNGIVGWNSQVQNVLTATVGNANYDIGHLFSPPGAGGNAGCIGCICRDNLTPAGKDKGSGWTSPGNNPPVGDNFDIDFVAHEIGHQLGGIHSFSYDAPQLGSATSVEPGSGSTIMGYAGVTGANTDVQPHSDPYFNTTNIRDIQANLISKTCDIETQITNTPPVIGTLPTYNIPKGTAFVLTASATDAENDPMTYTWEEVDIANEVINTNNLGNTASGPSFRSIAPSNSPTRYFPRISSVLAGVLNNSNNLWEAVSTVARTTRFTVTVRDNNPVSTEQQTQSATQTIIVGNNGPFKVNPTTVYNNGPTNVVWDVVNTNAAPYNAPNVKIDFTTDNGVTWNVVAASTPNDGSEALDFSAFPLTVGGTAKIRVSALNNVFYAIGSAPISTLPICNTNAPGGIVVTATTQTTATITWNGSFNATYIVRYRVAGATAWITVNPNPTVNTTTLQGLTAGTHYEVQIANICSGVTGNFSASTVFMTPYCAAASTNTNNGYISNVTVAATSSYTMSNNSGANNYTDYSADATKLITLVRGTSNNTVSVSKFWPGAMSNKAVSIWIDFDKNGTFETTERVLNAANNQVTPVTATFPVPATAYSGPLTTRMRVVMRDISSPAVCGSFANGEVEDYAVKLIDLPTCTTAAPSNITITNLTPTSANVSWATTAGATYILRYRKVGTTAWTTINPVLPPGNNYTIQGLTEQTQYEVQVSTICNNNQGAFSPSQQFTTPVLTYCPMTGTGTNEHISNVTVTSVNPALAVMNNTSVQNNYTNYTTPATLITLETGSVNNKISVAKGWSGATSNTAVTAWIDFNRDGQFDNAERILISAASSNTPVTAMFDVPSNAYSGPLTTTMRVALRRTSAPVMCQNITDGEVEDYAVRLRPCSTATPTGFGVNTVTHNSAVINWTAAADNITYLLQYRVQGAAAWTDIYVTSIPYTLNNLSPSTTYEVKIAANCGISLGTFTPVVVFTTRCDPEPPGVTVSSITTNSALITWAPSVTGVKYKMRWRKVGSTGWPNPEIDLPVAPANTYTLGSLDPYTAYEVQIASQCPAETIWNSYSNPVIFTTERTCELPPPGLTITQLLPTSAVIQWDPFPGATYLLRYRKVGIPGWTNIQVATNNYTLTGLSELTKYEMQVANICNGIPGTFTPPYYFTTPTVTYCRMSSGSSVGEHISKVTVKPNGKKIMENESGASTYTDYTGVPETFIELIQGSVDNEIIIEKKWTGNTYNEGIAVWIDFNRNGEFDVNERVFTSPPNTTSPVSGKFNVPVDAFVSMTDYKYVVMRVAMERDGVPVNCLSFKNGEVEDYSVRISKNVISNPLNQDDILIYPNPVSSVLYVKNIGKRAKYKIYSAVGQVIAEGILLNNQINVSKLINGVYVIDIDDNGKTVQKKFIKE